jgi:hypothetical protein
VERGFSGTHIPTRAQLGKVDALASTGASRPFVRRASARRCFAGVRDASIRRKNERRCPEGRRCSRAWRTRGVLPVVLHRRSS